MVYYTGDIHGSIAELAKFCHRMELNKDDIVVILGDVGANYYGNWRDDKLKDAFSRLKPTFFCIHGNHEMRPSSIPTYRTKQWCCGIVWYELHYPNLLFAKDGDIFNFDGLRHLVIGGAYSVDKPYRLSFGYNWWPDEQPSEDIKTYVEKQIAENKIDIVLSHTCPFKYEPREMFLPGIDQSSVDTGTERWLDKIEETIEYKAWFCGHWHTDKRIDKMHFLFRSIESIEQFADRGLCL